MILGQLSEGTIEHEKPLLTWEQYDYLKDALTEHELYWLGSGVGNEMYRKGLIEGLRIAKKIVAYKDIKPGGTAHSLPV